MNNHSLLTLLASPASLGKSTKRYAQIVAGLLMMLAFTAEGYAKGPKWEYRVLSVTLTNRQLESLLNANAAEGWELLLITHRNVAVFRRKK